MTEGWGARTVGEVAMVSIKGVDGGEIALGEPRGERKRVEQVGAHLPRA